MDPIGARMQSINLQKLKHQTWPSSDGQSDFMLGVHICIKKRYCLSNQNRNFCLTLIATAIRRVCRCVTQPQAYVCPVCCDSHISIWYGYCSARGAPLGTFMPCPGEERRGSSDSEAVAGSQADTRLDTPARDEAEPKEDESEFRNRRPGIP